MYRVHSKLAMRHAINTKYSNYIYIYFYKVCYIQRFCYEEILKFSWYKNPAVYSLQGINSY